MKTYFSLLFTAFFTVFFTFGQTHKASYQKWVNEVVYDSVHQKLQKFEDLGVKHMGSVQQENTRNWIKQIYTRLGYTDIVEQEVIVNGKKGYNIIITKQGSKYPNKYIVVGAHYDTLNGPGVNDNGTGTVALLEMAKVFVSKNTEYAMKFIHFTGEEAGLIGSKRYVTEIAKPQNLAIELMINIDEVGGVKGKENNSVVCEKDVDYPTSNDNSSLNYTNQMAAIIPMYTTLSTTIGKAYSSDYIPFQEAGYTITGLFEQYYSTTPHTPNDLLINMDVPYFYQVVKGAIAGVLHFSKAEEKLSITEQQNSTQIQFYPNPVTDKIYFKVDLAEKPPLSYRILSVDGKLMKSMVKTDFKPINVSFLPKGNFILSLEFSNKTENHSFIKH